MKSGLGIEDSHAANIYCQVIVFVISRLQIMKTCLTPSIQGSTHIILIARCGDLGKGVERHL